MPLIVACRAGHMDICEMLLSHRSRNPVTKKLTMSAEAAAMAAAELAGPSPQKEKRLVCYICENFVPAAQFQRHCDLCFVQHKMGQEIVQTQTRLQEVMYSIHALVKSTKACMGRVMVDIFKPVMNGYLERIGSAGPLKSRQRFWFELCRASLYYFKHEARSRDGHAMKGCLPLTHLLGVVPVPEKGEHVFQVDIVDQWSEGI